MEFKCTLVDKVSRNGVPYIALEIEFPNGYKKLVFLSPSEKCLVELCK